MVVKMSGNSGIQVYLVDTGFDGVGSAYDHLKGKGLVDGREKRITVGKKLLESDAPLYNIKSYELLDEIDIDVSAKLPLILNCSGSFHHLTYAFCRKFIDSFKVPYTVIHIDDHSDGMDKKGDPKVDLDCGYFYPHLMADSKFARTAIHITGSKKIGCVNERGKFDMVDYRCKDAADAVKKTLENVKTDYVYITIDLDALKSQYVETDWGNGDMELSFLLDYLAIMGKKKTLIGADVCGLGKDGYSGVGRSDDLKSLETHSAVVSTLLDNLYFQERPWWLGVLGLKQS